MKRKTHTNLLLRAFRKAFVISLLVSFFVPLLQAQEIHVRVLNARNGKPITNECLNVSIGTWHGPDIVAATRKDGVALLRIVNNELAADASCPGWPAQAPLPTSVDAITIVGDKYVVCQEYGKFVPGEPPTPNSLKEMVPSYPIKKILETGVAAGNTCGKFRSEAKPGELILFVRPQGVLERLKE